MKRSLEATTVAHLVERLRRSGVFGEAGLEVIEQHWEREAGDTVDALRFARWLVARQYLNDAQADQLLRDELRRPASAVPIAQAAPIVPAAIVAPPAQPRPSRNAVPIAAPARPDAAVSPMVDVELVADAEPEAATVELPTIAEPAAPEPNAPPTTPAESAGAELTVELVPILEERPAKSAPPPPIPQPSPPNVWLYLFLGALSLLILQFAGWALAHLLALLLQ
jgi:hypothetical protein